MKGKFEWKLENKAIKSESHAFLASYALALIRGRIKAGVQATRVMLGMVQQPRWSHAP